MRIELPGAALVLLFVAAAATAQVKKGDLPGVTNYSRVDATIGCGGATQPAAMAALKNEGYASVVNLRMASEQGAEIDASRAAAQAAGLRYIHLPFDAANPDPQVVDSFIAAVSDRANQPVYIHCASANRVGAMWMIKRALKDGWSVDQASAEAEAIGLTNPKLKAFATEYIASHKK